MNNQRAAYGFCKFVSLNHFPWVKLFKLDHYKPQFAIESTEREDRIANNYAVKFKRRRDFVLHKACYMQRLGEDDLRHIVMIDGGLFHSFHHNPLDFLLWAHNMTCMLSIPGESPHEVPGVPYWVWPHASDFLLDDAKLGAWENRIIRPGVRLVT
jgi:hypothetical protein